MFYDLSAYVEYPGRWRLGRLQFRTGVRVDSRVFCRGKRVEANGLVLSVPKPGVVNYVGPIVVGCETNSSPEEYELTAVRPGWEQELVLPIKKQGIELEFDGDPDQMPVAIQPLAEALAELAPDEVQLFPVEIPGRHRQYSIVNVTRTLDCIDERRTRGERHPPGSPDKYRYLSDIHILPEIAAGHHLFRLAHWEVALICSQYVRDLFEAHRVRGATFDPVL